MLTKKQHVTCFSWAERDGVNQPNINFSGYGGAMKVSYQNP